jgi:integrase
VPKGSLATRILPCGRSASTRIGGWRARCGCSGQEESLCPAPCLLRRSSGSTRACPGLWVTPCRDLIARNVAKDAKLPQAKKRKVKPPTPAQLGAFLDASHGERLYPLLVLAGYSGLRRGELVGLKWSDLDMSTGKIVVARQISSVNYQVEESDAKTEAGQDRTVFIDQVVREMLTGWAATQLTEKAMWGAEYHDGGWMFTREDGLPLHPDRVTKVASRLLRRAGLEATLHGLRHFWAAALISSGADISAVSKAMGHASISVTSDIYGSLFDKASADMSQRASALIPRQSVAAASETR